MFNRLNDLIASPLHQAAKQKIKDANAEWNKSQRVYGRRLRQLCKQHGIAFEGKDCTYFDFKVEATGEHFTVASSNSGFDNSYEGCYDYLKEMLPDVARIKKEQTV